jgi:hypothetical protein
MVWLIFFGPRLFLFLFLKNCFVYAFEARIYFTWDVNDADDVPSEFLHVEILGSCNSRSKIAKLQDLEKLLLKAREKKTPGSSCRRSSASHSGQVFQNFYYSLHPGR